MLIKNLFKVSNEETPIDIHYGLSDETKEAMKISELDFSSFDYDYDDSDSEY